MPSPSPRTHYHYPNFPSRVAISPYAPVAAAPCSPFLFWPSPCEHKSSLLVNRSSRHHRPTIVTASPASPGQKRAQPVYSSSPGQACPTEVG
ncbi:hypothetical protein NL676_023843 [Syzygium grande]|nr:hypothetical protein NL676_023843 [Syzygium grande]